MAGIRMLLGCLILFVGAIIVLGLLVSLRLTEFPPSPATKVLTYLGAAIMTALTP